MTQIENLIVVEVPKGSKDPQLGNGNGVFVFHDTKPIGTATRIQLPFPCEIIGLASEVNQMKIREVLTAAKSYIGWIAFRNYHLISPDKDYLFLKRKG